MNQTFFEMMSIVMALEFFGALLWLNFSIIDSRKRAFGQRLGINASILPNSLAQSSAQVGDSKISISGPLTSIEVACMLKFFLQI